MITRPTHVTFLVDEDTQQIAGYIDREGRQRDMTGAPLGNEPLPPAGMVSKADLANATDPAKGAALVGLQQGGIGWVGRTVADKALEHLSVLDLMTGAEKAASRAWNFSVDHLAAIERALDYLSLKAAARWNSRMAP